MLCRSRTTKMCTSGSMIQWRKCSPRPTGTTSSMTRSTFWPAPLSDKSESSEVGYNGPWSKVFPEINKKMCLYNIEPWKVVTSGLQRRIDAVHINRTRADVGHRRVFRSTTKFIFEKELVFFSVLHINNITFNPYTIQIKVIIGVTRLIFLPFFGSVAEWVKASFF